MTVQSVNDLEVIMKEKLSRKEKEKQFHRQLIIQAAAKIFAKNGYEKTTLDEIAELAEFSKGSLYNYFANKEDLFISTFEAGMDRIYSEIQSRLESCEGAIKAIHTILDVNIEFLRNNRDFLHIFINHRWKIAAGHNQALVQRMQIKFTIFTRLYTRIMTEGIENGELRPGDPKIYSGMLQSIIHFQIHRMLCHDCTPEPDISETLLDLFLNGVKA